MAMSAPVCDGEIEQKVNGARLFRVGEGDGREVRVRVGLRDHDGRGRKPGAGERFQHQSRRRRRAAVCTRSRTSAIGHQRTARDGGDVVVAGPARRASRSRPTSGSCEARGAAAIAASIERVLRRDDLDATAEVDLVAVVLRRVVAGGHHDPGVGAAGAHRVRQHRGRQRLAEEFDAAAPRRPSPARCRPRTRGCGGGRRNR